MQHLSADHRDQELLEQRSAKEIDLTPLYTEHNVHWNMQLDRAYDLGIERATRSIYRRVAWVGVWLAVVLSAVCMLENKAHAQQNMGPIATPQINTTLYVGQTGYPTIQSAVTAACTKAGTANWQVVIPAGAAPADTIPTVNGCDKAYILDQRTVQILAYAWSGTAYAAVPAGTPGVVYAANFTTLSAIESACSAYSVCQVIVTTPQTFTLTGNHTIPSTIAFQFLQGGVWTVNGAGFVLNFGNGAIDAGLYGIFAGTAAVGELVRDRPEWFPWTQAPILESAVKALSSNGGVVDLEQSGYRPGYGYPSTDVMNRDNIWIRGSGAGIPADNLTHCTGGTRILGSLPISGANNFHISDLCVDAGTDVIATWYVGVPGNATDALGVYSTSSGGTSPVPPTLYGTIDNVVGLVDSPGAPNHGILIENVFGLRAHNLTSYGGVHGIVFKDQSGSAQGLVSRHHGTEGVYIKSDIYAAARDFHVSDITADDTPTGILIQAASSDLQSVTAKGVTCTETVPLCVWLTPYGGRLMTGTVVSDIVGRTGRGVLIDAAVNDAVISNVSLESPQQAVETHAAMATISNVVAHGVTAGGAAIVIGSDAGSTNLSNIILGGGTGSAVATAGAVTTLSNLQIDGAWGGACVINSAGTLSVRNVAVGPLGLCGSGKLLGSNITQDNKFGTVITTTGTASDTVNAPGLTASSACHWSAANASAAADAAADFMGSLTTNSFTFNHGTTTGMIFRLDCQL